MWNGFPDGNVTDFLRDADAVQVQKTQEDTPTTTAAVDGSTAAAAPQNMTSLLTCSEDGVEGALGSFPPSSATDAAAEPAAAAAPPTLPLLPLLPLDAAPPIAAATALPAIDPIVAFQFAQLPPEILNMASLVIASAPGDPAAMAALQQIIADHLATTARMSGMQGPALALAGGAVPLHPAGGEQAAGISGVDGATASVSASGTDQKTVVGAPAQAGSTDQDEGGREAKRIKLDDGTAGAAPQAGAAGSSAAPMDTTLGFAPLLAGQVGAAASTAAVDPAAAASAVDAGSAAAVTPGQAQGVVQSSTDQQAAAPFNMLQGAEGLLAGMPGGMPANLNLAFLESMKFLNQQMHMRPDGSAPGDAASAEAIQQNAAAAAAFEAHIGLLTNAHAAAAAAGLVGYDGTPLMLPPLLPLAGVEGGAAAGGGDAAAAAAAGGDPALAAAAADAAQSYVQMLLNSRMPGLEQLAAAAVAAQLAESLNPGSSAGGMPGMLAALGAATPVAAPPVTSETSEDDGTGGRRVVKRGPGRPPKNRQPTAAAAAAAAAAASAAAANGLLQAQGLPGAAAAALAGLPPGFPHMGLYGASMYGLLEGFDASAMMNSAAGLQGLLQPGVLGAIGAPPSGSGGRHVGKLASSVRKVGGGLPRGATEDGGTGGEGDGGSGDDDKRGSGEAGKASRITVARLKEVYHLNIEEAAKELGIGMTKLKEHCRQLGIPRWPSRKLRSMDKLIESLHEQAERDPASAQMVDEVIGELQHFKDMIYHDPSVEVEEHIKRLRQSNFKKEYQQRQSSKVTRGGSGDDEATPKPRHGSTARQNASAAAAIADAHAASTAAAQAHIQDQANAAAVACMFTAMGGFPDFTTMMAQMTPDNALSLAQLMQSHQAAVTGVGLPPVTPLVATLPSEAVVGGDGGLLADPQQQQQQMTAELLMSVVGAAQMTAELSDVPPVVPLTTGGSELPLPSVVIEEVGTE